MSKERSVSDEPVAVDTPVFSIDDDAALLAAVRDVISAAFDIELQEVPGDAWGAETDLGTLFVGTMSDLIIGLELRLPGEFDQTLPLLEYLNERNAGTTLVVFSVLDGGLWLSGYVDGHPFAPNHLVRTLDFMFQAAVAVGSDLEPDAT